MWRWVGGLEWKFGFPRSALGLEGITPDQAGEALLKISQGYARESQWQPANAAFENALALERGSDALKIKAYFGEGNIWMNYGDWSRVKTANAAALGFANRTLRTKNPSAESEGKSSSEPQGISRRSGRDERTSGIW